MRLSEYLDTPGAKGLQQISDDSQVSYTTLKAVARGMTLKKYDIAKRVSDAVGVGPDGNPLVSIKELCEE